MKKIKLGQFYTKKCVWLKKHIIEFIKNSKSSIVCDPFAGKGDLLKHVSNIVPIKKLIGFDIDKSLKWKFNDSLLNIPKINNAIYITNPPWIAKQSARRKGINLDKYFSSSSYDDLYLIALDKLLETKKKVVALIPESFINSNFEKKYLLHSITVLEQNPFNDTENPVCVACFDNIKKDFSKVKVYKNNKFISTFDKILSLKLFPKKNIKIHFNDKSGWLGLRAIDSTKNNVCIEFNKKQNIKYDWNAKIKESSRHFTLINIDVPLENRDDFVKETNRILNKLRHASADILLTPFKGNNNIGIRRRRLDFSLARAIQEEAYKNLHISK